MLPLHVSGFFFGINSRTIYALYLFTTSFLLPTIIHSQLYATPQKEDWAKPLI
jgi:hypothetical protein